MLAPIIANNINEIKTLCKKHKVKELYVFGSAVSDKFNDESDVDLLVEFDSVDLMEYAENHTNFTESLEKLFGRAVDLVTAKYLRNRFFIKEINETKQVLFAA